MPAQLELIRGRVLAPDPDKRRIAAWPDALIRIDPRGRITELCAAPADCELPETWPGAVILPGFVDCHLHYPQTRIIGSASGPLLPWLQRSVFPEEARFAEREYASVVAEEFCDAMIAQGTTSAGVFSSSHPLAAQVLLETLDRRGLRAVTGVTLMDRSAPDSCTLAADPAIAALAELHERWHGHDEDRLRIAVIPRFGISCTPELLRRAAEFADQHGLIVHTHISENHDELEVTAELFPESRDYLGVYDDHGLASARTILAHAVHLSDDEWARVVGSDLAVAHCPDSNFFLGSGCMPLRTALERGVRIGLGSDVGAGRTFSMRRVAASAYDASLVREAMVEPEQLLWLATRGGARVLGPATRLGCIAPGFDADLVAVDVPGHVRELGETIDALLFRHDAGPVRATLVRGRVL
ncbi:Guanine deaminase [Enhygromyxa salina]|uniref:Guanine deaminase n=1 Tax=Enhygromyxa salina TaxID=215803 RepID=A0A2S9XBC9_9BACT|nr:guanine deaminase [Enhygromyxa salina]PRP90100.1 Guanine deaminase [Enhygromyxa salina]